MPEPKRVTRQAHERLAQLRREKAVSEWRDIPSAEVARDLDETRATWHRYESGATPMPDDVVERAARYYGVNRAWLRYGEGDKHVSRDTKITEARSGKSGGR